jgi:uncharacterized membrane protein
VAVRHDHRSSTLQAVKDAATGVTESPLASKPLDPGSIYDLIPPGEDMGRIISLSDGVFAFAMTLLVLSLTVPDLISKTNSANLASNLQGEWVYFLGYVFAFYMIATWWLIHHRMFTFIKRYDAVLVGLNMAILLEIAVLPFVLGVFDEYSGTQVAVCLFAAAQGVTGITFALLWRYATENHRLVDPQLDQRRIRYIRARGIVVPSIFLVSIPATFVSLSYAPLLWIGAFAVPQLMQHLELY